MDNNTVGRPMEILLVEDSLTSARVTMGALRNGGIQHRMTWLTDGEEALEFLFRDGKFLRAPRPDLILLDLNLPKRNGREVLQVIKNNNKLKSIPVVVLTTSDADEDILKSYRLGANSYVTKPVGLEQFAQIVKSIESFWFTVVKLPPR